MSLPLPKISVIIPHLNQPEGLASCLSSLEAQTIERSLFEIVVVDNGSREPPAELVASIKNARMISEPEPGPGPARNAGVRSASGEILAFIDADCRAHPEWLRVAACGIESSDGRTLLGGDVQIWDDGASNCTAIEAYERVFAYRFKMYIERQGFSGTGNLITPRDAFDKIGPFAGIRVAEDMEWGARALSSGFRFQHVPEMIVFHPARRTLDELYQKWDRQTQHYLNMNAAKGGRLWKARWVLRALAILASPALDIGSVLRSKKVAGWSARSKAIMVLCQVRTHRALKMLTLMFGRRQVRWNENSLEA